jgi:TRAP-type mannitol/chloroaromatic compound transport system substrate-binding protein
VAQLALLWAGSSAYATDVLWEPSMAPGVCADALVVLSGLQPDPLVQALLHRWGERATQLALWAEVPAVSPAQGHACEDAEDEAQRAAACVVQHLNAGRLPVALVANADEHLKALPVLKSVLKEGIAKWNVEVPGFLGFSIVDASLFCREPVKSLDELKKKKLRVGSREQVETFKRLGVAAQIVPQNELYAALQTGVVDCALYAARFANSISLQEVAKHVTPTGCPFPPAPYALLANKAKWAALPADLKKGFNEAVVELEKVSFNFDGDVSGEKAARDKLISQGSTFYPALSAADQKALRGSALETWDVLAKETGGDAVVYRQRILQALPK